MIGVAPDAGLGDASRARGTLSLRYEDVAQNGWLKPVAMLHGLGRIAFGKIWHPWPPSVALRARGTLPILSRLRAENLEGPLSVALPVEVEAWLRLAQVRDAEGKVQRMLLLAGAELFAPRARTHSSAPPGERLPVGRVFAEHVFTRPFAAPAERKVTSLDLPSELDDPRAALSEASFEEAASTLRLGPSEQPLDADFASDAAPVVFGLGHTDSNQHVNSLAYVPLFEDAALRRFESHGIGTANLLLRRFEIAYRKPCFAGERVQIRSRALSTAGAPGARLYLGAEGASGERAHCMAALDFRAC